MSIKLKCVSSECRHNKSFYDVEIGQCMVCGMLTSEQPYLRYLLSFKDENGKTKREVVRGSYEAAKFRLRQIENDIAMNRYIPSYKYKNWMVKDFVNWYGDLSDIKKLKSYKQRMGRLRAIIQTVGHFRIRQITKGKIESLLKSKDHKPSTIYNNLILLKLVFDKAVAYELISENPIKDLKFNKSKNKRKSYISYKDLLELLIGVREPYRSWIILAYYTGMRRQEIVELKWEEVDLKNKVIQLTDRTKNKMSRTIPIEEDVLMNLFINRERGINVSVWNNQKRPPVFSNREFKKIMANFPNFTFHDFRRCAIVNMKRNGVRDEIIRSIVGHSSEITTMIYDTLIEGELKGFSYNI